MPNGVHIPRKLDKVIRRRRIERGKQPYGYVYLVFKREGYVLVRYLKNDDKFTEGGGDLETIYFIELENAWINETLGYDLY